MNAAEVWSRWPTLAPPNLDEIEVGKRAANSLQWENNQRGPGGAAGRRAWIRADAYLAEALRSRRVTRAAFPWSWEVDEQTERRRPTAWQQGEELSA